MSDSSKRDEWPFPDEAPPSEEERREAMRFAQLTDEASSQTPLLWEGSDEQEELSALLGMTRLVSHGLEDAPGSLPEARKEAIEALLFGDLAKQPQEAASSVEEQIETKAALETPSLWSRWWQQLRMGWVMPVLAVAACVLFVMLPTQEMAPPQPTLPSQASGLPPIKVKQKPLRAALSDSPWQAGTNPFQQTRHAGERLERVVEHLRQAQLESSLSDVGASHLMQKRF